jgi:hypothetical protein
MPTFKAAQLDFDGVLKSLGLRGASHGSAPRFLILIISGLFHHGKITHLFKLSSDSKMATMPLSKQGIFQLSRLCPILCAEQHVVQEG